MRLLDKSNLQLDMTKLGFDAEPLKGFKEAIDRPYGMVLVTGPTGLGQDHHALLGARRAQQDRRDNICTAEDPVEFNLAGINQVQMHEDIGLNFAAALRAFLRQDPDIIMVGEIRDFETAEIGVKAALTGHLVLSTLHTNDAPGTISRLLNMGIEPFLVTASRQPHPRPAPARASCCQDCKEPVRGRPSRRCIDAGVPPDKIGTFTGLRAGGLPRPATTPATRAASRSTRSCRFWDGLKELVLNGASAAELKQEAIRLGMQHAAHGRRSTR